MTRRGWLLFTSMAFIWGVPYFFIRVAVKDLSPPLIVFGRTSIAAVVLFVLARRAGAITPALLRWRPVLAFAILEMAIPWILLTHAETHLASGLAALIIASVPVVGSIAAFVLGDRSALRPVRLVGIALGLSGVGLLVGHDLSGDSAPPWWSIAEVLIVVVCYATAPFIASRRLHEVPSLGVISVALSTVAIIYLPIAAFSLPDNQPPVGARPGRHLHRVGVHLVLPVDRRDRARARRSHHLRQPGRGRRARRRVPGRTHHAGHRRGLLVGHRGLLVRHALKPDDIDRRARGRQRSASADRLNWCISARRPCSCPRAFVPR
jgi:drug/metabolite transporter (DMT)-like permease